MPGGWIMMGRAGWADAATIVPWAVYESYGSTEVLERQLDSMRRWVDHLERRAGERGLLPTEFQFGDWLDPDAPGEKPWEAKVSADYVANAFFARSARLLADAERLSATPSVPSARAARRPRRPRHLGRVGRGGDRDADRLPRSRSSSTSRRPPSASASARRSPRNVRDEHGRIATGFLGTPLVLFALVHTGHVDEAYLMLLRQAPPSWLYQVEMGATTVWERWDALAPDGTIHSGEMATGATGCSRSTTTRTAPWSTGSTGTSRASPPRWSGSGYRRIVVAPRPTASIPWARASVESRLGEVSIDWRLDDGDLEIDLRVPHGADAVLDLPLTAASTVTIDGRVADVAPPTSTRRPWTRGPGGDLGGGPDRRSGRPPHHRDRGPNRRPGGARRGVDSGKRIPHLPAGEPAAYS